MHKPVYCGIEHRTVWCNANDNSLGHGMAAVALKLMEFPDKAKPGLVPEETVWWLGVVDSPLSIVPGIIAAVLYAQYRINKKGYGETRRQLEQRDVDDNLT